MAGSLNLDRLPVRLSIAIKPYKNFIFTFGGNVFEINLCDVESSRRRSL